MPPRRPPRRIATVSDAAAETRDYEAAQGQRRIGNYQGAIVAFQNFLKQYPKSNLAPRAQYWIGDSYFNLRDYRLAISSQQTLLKTYPDSPTVPDAILNMASSQIEMGESVAGKKDARRTAREIPDQRSGGQSQAPACRAQRARAHPRRDAARRSRGRQAIVPARGGWRVTSKPDTALAERTTPDATQRAATLRITEIFFSLQGETSRTGLPTIFVRLTGCPLRCGYCDTAYAFHGGETMTLAQVLDAVAQYRTRYVTVTGGEPLAQQACIALLRELCDREYSVSLETSGAIDVSTVDVARVENPRSQDAGLGRMRKKSVEQSRPPDAARRNQVRDLQ